MPKRDGSPALPRGSHAIHLSGPVNLNGCLERPSEPAAIHSLLNLTKTCSATPSTGGAFPVIRVNV